MSTSYKILRNFVRLLMRIFFSQIRVRNEELMPERGAVIFAMNHPNNLMDTLVVGSVINRKIHYLATGQLFKNRLLAAILKSLGVIPVYRKEDSPDKGTDRNVQSFEACTQLLKEGGAIGIYPEGITHSERQVKKIKTGAARIALEAEAQNNFRLGLVIVPIGLNFSARRFFRSEVLVNIGTPIRIADWEEAYRKNPIETVQKLTDEIWRRIAERIVHIDRIDMDSLVERIESLYKGELILRLMDEKRLPRAAIDDVRLSRKIVNCVNHYQTQDPEIVRKMHRAILNYNRKLHRLRLRDDVIRKEMKEKLLIGTYLKIALKGILGMPIFLYGLINNFLPHRLARIAGLKLSKKPTDVAMIKLGVGTITFPLFYGIQTYTCWKILGSSEAFIYLLSLPSSGLFALRFGKKINRYIHNIHFSYLYLAHKRLLFKIREERRKLMRQIELMKDQYLTTTRENRKLPVG